MAMYTINPIIGGFGYCRFTRQMKDKLNGLSPLLLETDIKTDDFTLKEGVEGKIVAMNKSGAGQVTVPSHVTWNCPVGTVTGIYNLSQDPVSIAGADGVTVRNAGNLAQYGEASLRKRAQNEWVLVGVAS